VHLEIAGHTLGGRGHAFVALLPTGGADLAVFLVELESVDHAQGLTPPAEFAYRRAAQLLPGHPAPRFFYDLALLRSGGGDPAVKDLIALMREYPDASWRPMVGTTLLVLVMNSERRPKRPAR